MNEQAPRPQFTVPFTLSGWSTSTLAVNTMVLIPPDCAFHSMFLAFDRTANDPAGVKSSMSLYLFQSRNGTIHRLTPPIVFNRATTDSVQVDQAIDRFVRGFPVFVHVDLSYNNPGGAAPGATWWTAAGLKLFGSVTLLT